MNEPIRYIPESSTGLYVTEAATTYLVSCLEKNASFTGIRLSLKKTGCSGLSYVVDYIEEPKDSDFAFPLNEQYQVYIDRSSFPYLKGTVVDYVKENLGSKLVFNNPNQTGECGCGESFTTE